jgi:2-oxo-4-hydroxy-4-carboxy--5-ureidoimidazoline (OHCU) decarboxylase
MSHQDSDQEWKCNDCVEIEVDGDTYAKLALAADAAESSVDEIAEQALADVGNDALSALAALLAAFPDLGRGYSTAEQQTALRRARRLVQP